MPDTTTRACGLPDYAHLGKPVMGITGPGGIGGVLCFCGTKYREQKEGRHAMGLNTQSQEANSKIRAYSSLIQEVCDEARILIICDDDSITERLNIAFREAGLISECARSMTAGCTSARSGRFQVVFTIPVLGDGSWRRLADIANNYDLGLVVVLVASDFDFNQYAEALEDGAFDVLDALHELPRTAEAARCALWAAYLKGAGPRPEVASHPMAA
jgi:hypothetical protein